MTLSSLEICYTMAGWLTQPPQNPHWSPETWHTARLICRVHGIAPWLYQVLAGADWLAPETETWFSEQYRLNSARTRQLQTDAGHILAAFATAGLPVIPLKGIALVEACYADGGVRPMADIDLLLPPEKLAPATEIMARLGYEPEVKHWKHTVFIRPENMRVVSTAGEHPDNPRRVELHPACTENFNGPAVDITALLWRDAMPSSVAGQPVFLPRPDIFWLHLLVHTTYHLWQGRSRLLHLLDLWQAARQHAPATRAMLAETLSNVDARFTYPAVAMLRQIIPQALLPIEENDFYLIQQKRVSPRFQAWVDTLNPVTSSYLNPDPPGTYLGRAIQFSDGRPAEIARALRWALLPALDELAMDHPRLARSRLPWLAYLLLPLDWGKRLARRNLP
jgi:hypothetical protein